MKISWWPEQSVVVKLDMVVYRRVGGYTMLWPPGQKVLKELATMQILELAIAADKKVCCWSLEQITISLTIKNAIIMPDSRFPLDLVPTTRSVYSSTYWPFYQKAPFFRHVMRSSPIIIMSYWANLGSVVSSTWHDHVINLFKLNSGSRKTISAFRLVV